MAQSQRYLHCLQNWKSTLHFCSSHQNPRENSSCMHLYRNVTPRGSYHTRGGGLCSWLKLSSFSDISLCEWRRAVSRFGNRIPSVILWLRPASGCQSSNQSVGAAIQFAGLTYVEYGRYAPLVMVMLILGSFGSQGRMPTSMILSSVGGLSTK